MYDNANPELKAYANLTVTVKRNENQPTFHPEEFNVNIMEIEPVGTTIATVGSEEWRKKIYTT